MVCQFLLYNKVNQLYIYIYPHISSLLCLPPILPIPPLQVVTKHQADLPVLCGCFPLAIYFTFGSVYMSMTFSHFVPDYLSPSPCPQVHSLRLRLYSCPAWPFFDNPNVEPKFQAKVLPNINPMTGHISKEDNRKLVSSLQFLSQNLVLFPPISILNS